MKIMNLAWCHDMAPTCCGKFAVRFAKAHTLTINKVILEQVLSRYNRKHKYIETVGVLLTSTIYVPPRVPIFY